MNKENKTENILKSKKQDRVTYAELSNQFSHFEIAFLSFQKAIEIIRSAVYISIPDQNNNYKPKVAVVALEALCSDPQQAVELKSNVQKQIFEQHIEEIEKDSYNVDEGHAPKS
jgi:hypothetical protein